MADLSSLRSVGWRLLPASPGQDQVALGPGGVVLLRAAPWRTATTVTPDQRLVTSRHDRTELIDDLAAEAESFRWRLAVDGGRVAVHPVLVLHGTDDRTMTPRAMGQVCVLGADQVAAWVTLLPGDADVDLMEAVGATVGVAPNPGGEPSAPSALFERAHRFFYLKRWKKAGHDRLYLRDRDGTTLGWTDVNTGATSLDCDGEQATFATALLAAADPTGIKLAPGDLPKVATRHWGGRLLSRVARWHTSVLVGQEWQAFGKHRLYGTLIDPNVTTFGLGWVDLKTGEVHPSVEGNLAEDRGPADRYLGYLRYHLPSPPARR